MHTPSCLEEPTGFARKATAGLPLIARSTCPLEALPRPHTLRARDLPAPSEVPRVEGQGLLRPQWAGGQTSPLWVSMPASRPPHKPRPLGSGSRKEGTLPPQTHRFPSALRLPMSPLSVASFPDSFLPGLTRSQASSTRTTLGLTFSLLKTLPSAFHSHASSRSNTHHLKSQSSFFCW